jgi:hypothetical protein
VQDGEESDLGSQVLGIGSDGAQSLSGGGEEQVVDYSLILIGDVCNGFGQCEDDVEVLNLE